ncbi:MAG TPA: N-acetyltransferase [Anaerolineae bacterium]|nr:N-acetyltransferase [Anaerolineae bacterium]
MTVVITKERPDTPDAIQLIEGLESDLAPFYPSESRHGYSVEKLIKQNVTFFITRKDGVPAGCGGVQFFGTEYGEVKRMYVRPEFRGFGLAKLMLEELSKYTKENGIYKLRLETGIHQKDAIALYRGWGFKEIAHFGEYKADPLSLFFEKIIQ